MSNFQAISWCILFFVVLGGPDEAAAQDEPDEPPGWSATAELTGVWTAGNSPGSTFGLNASLVREWSEAEFRVAGGGIRTETVRITRTARGTRDSFDVVEDTERERTAESYYARTRYDRQFSETLYAFGGADWLRNTFSGIESRFLFAVGAGNRWIATDRARLKTDLGVTYTLQEDVVENPFISSNFAGVRAAADLRAVLTPSAELSTALVADWNLDETEDVRLDWTTSLPVSINARIALKPSLQLLWRNEPSLTEVPLLTPDGSATGDVVAIPLEKLDTFFTLAVVVKV